MYSRGIGGFLTQKLAADKALLKESYALLWEMDETIRSGRPETDIIEILMSRMQKLKGLSAASLRLKTFNVNPFNRHCVR